MSQKQILLRKDVRVENPGFGQPTVVQTVNVGREMGVEVKLIEDPDLEINVVRKGKSLTLWEMRI